MNRDITDLVIAWVNCSHDLWVKWFKELSHGLDRFSEIEMALFKAMIADEIGIPFRTSSPFESLGVMYQSQVTCPRQVCRRQSSRNVFCKSEKVSIDAGVLHQVQSIDPLGTMMEGVPYVEVIFRECFILEPVDNLRYFINTPMVSPSDVGG